MTATTAIAPGTRMPDGTICAGINPHTGRPFFTTPRDAPLIGTFGQAAQCARKLDAHGHRDWRVPTRAELNVLFRNRAAIGGFDTTGSHPAGWYGSSSRLNLIIAWSQRFSDGELTLDLLRLYHSALRCVRG